MFSEAKARGTRAVSYLCPSPSPERPLFAAQADSDCGGCCSKNSGKYAYALLDIEKWPASYLLSFDPTGSDFDINGVAIPSAAGKRPLMGKKAASGVMPICFRDVGPAVLSPKP